MLDNHWRWPGTSSVWQCGLVYAFVLCVCVRWECITYSDDFSESGLGISFIYLFIYANLFCFSSTRCFFGYSLKFLLQIEVVDERSLCGIKAQNISILISWCSRWKDISTRRIFAKIALQIHRFLSLKINYSASGLKCKTLRNKPPSEHRQHSAPKSIIFPAFHIYGNNYCDEKIENRWKFNCGT